MQTFMEDEMAEDGPQRELSLEYMDKRDKILSRFEVWTEADQVDFIENLLLRVCHYQHGQINEFLTPMLQRDFITLLPSKSIIFGTIIVVVYFHSSTSGVWLYFPQFR